MWNEFFKKTRATVPTTLKLTICLKTKLKWRFFSSRTLRIHDTSNDMIPLHQRRPWPSCKATPPPHPSSRHPPHLPREKKMRLRERECCTSHEAWEDGDKRYPGNEVDLEHDDYDVMCLDTMQHEKLLFYISLSFCFYIVGQEPILLCVPCLGFCISV